eukprot:Nitzschia sp. Nitz4//scaffold10_size219509//69926//71679//NITZ4_001415-RA/size219509-snap-gene-0.390-mRNA-1//-1//CDS//3329532881//838//frame0
MNKRDNSQRTCSDCITKMLLRCPESTNNGAYSTMSEYDAFEVEDEFIRSFVNSLSTENATSGVNWFDNNIPICEFVGIQCNSDGYVSIIDFSSFGLLGVLPRSFWPLSQLERLTLRNNQLTGPIPPLFPATLAHLSLERNMMQGTIPKFQFPGNLTTASIQRLILSDNDLEGTIPTEICNLSSLRSLNLSLNPELTGMLPSCLSELHDLTGLQVYETRLLGPVHKQLCQNQSGNEDFIGVCEKYDFCLDGYYRQSNAGIEACEPCAEPSNILDSDYFLPLLSPSGSPSNISGTSTSAPSLAPSEGVTYRSSPGGLSNDGNYEASHPPTKVPTSAPTTTSTFQNSILPLYSLEPTRQPDVSLLPTTYGSEPPYMDPNSVQGSDYVSGTNRNHSTPLFLRCFSSLAFVVCVIALFWFRRRRNRGPIPNVTVICWENQDHASILDLEAKPSSERDRILEPEVSSDILPASKLFPVPPLGNEVGSHEYRGISPRIANQESCAYITSPEGVDVEFRSTSSPSSASTLGVLSPLADEISSEESDLFEAEEYDC